MKVDIHLRGHAAIEGSVQRYVDERTAAPVPGVIAVGNDYFVAEWDEAIASIVDPRERNPSGPDGANQESTASPDESWARAAGRWLATLHDDTEGSFDGFGPFRLGEDDLELTGSDDWVDVALDRVASHRSFLADHGYADVADGVEVFLEEHPHVFNGAGEPVLCHGNVHPEHLAVVGGQAVAGIDFEHAIVAPAEYDYWRTVTPLFERRGAAEEPLERAFRAGYESVRPLPTDLERRRGAYALVNLVSYLESLFLQRNLGPDARAVRGVRLRELVFETIGNWGESVE